MSKLFFLFFWVFFFPLSFTLAEVNKADNNIDTYFRYIPSSDAKDMPGDIELSEAAIEFSRKIKVGGKLPVKLSVTPSHIAIKNSTPVKLPAKLTGLVTDIETTMPFFGFEETYQRIGISPSFYGDSWDFDTSDFRIPMRYYIIRRPNEKWTLMAGFAICPDFETEILPILGFIYRPNDRLTFNIVPVDPEISYIFNDKLTVFLEGGNAFNSEFEVDKDERENVILRRKQTRLGTGVRYSFNNFAQASISLGAAFNRSFKYRDSLGKVNLDDGIYSEVRLQIGF